MLYTSLIRSLFEYVSPLLVGLYQKLSGKLEKAHKIGQKHECLSSWPKSDWERKFRTIRDGSIIVEELYRSIEVSSSHPLFLCT